MTDIKKTFLSLKGGAEGSYKTIGSGENTSLYGGGVRFGERTALDGSSLRFDEWAISADYYSDGGKNKVVNLGSDITLPFLFFVDATAGTKAELEDASDRKLRWRVSPFLGLSATIPLIWDEKNPMPDLALDARLEAGILGFNGNGLVDSFTGLNTTLGVKWFF